MVANKLELPHISAETPTSLPMFWRTRSWNIAVQKLRDVSGGQKSNFAAVKPKLSYISGCTYKDRITLACFPAVFASVPLSKLQRLLICDLGLHGDKTSEVQNKKHSYHCGTVDAFAGKPIRSSVR